MSENENPHGTRIDADGRVRFRLWAPACQQVHVEVVSSAIVLPMTPLPDGWHELITGQAHVGTRYFFVLPNGTRVPDPASRFQPDDVNGPSEVTNPSRWIWSDTAWRGRPWEQAVIYEMHIGAFSPEGTFRGALAKLDHLVDLGVTAIQLMPVADFPGQRNWGYDGVLLYAPDSSYGRPEDLKALVEAAHAKNLMIFLDVVYNHFGPEGNYLSLYAPQFFNARHQTPWGNAVNFDGPHSAPVREFAIQNALYWLRDFHFDGLRLDAVHAIKDESAQPVIEELAERVRRTPLHRHVHLILENEENQASPLVRVTGDADRQPRFYNAQWNDDVHHALHTAATGEDQGYYAEYRSDSDKLGRALAQGFAFQGEMMAYRGAFRGEPSKHLPPSAFVAFAQNHDQVGNRAFGDRLNATASASALRAVAAVYLLLPQIPMLFMGEEWNTTAPFPFFCDFGPALADAVRDGRRKEFARFPEFHDPAQRDRIPDPQAPETFAAAKLPWAEKDQPEHAHWLAWYRAVLAKRQQYIIPLVAKIKSGGSYQVLGEGAVLVRWQWGAQEELTLAANLSPKAIQFPCMGGRAVWQEGAADESTGLFEPWSVRFSIATVDGSR